MKTDRELLGLAAKAAGYNIKWHDMKGGYERALITPKLNEKWWNPISDDGDAFRLAVKLKIDVLPMWGKDCVCVTGDGKHFEEPRLPNELSSMRRAIVRAAAAIGESK